MDLTALSDRVAAARGALQEQASGLLRDGGVDANQVAANALVWGVAHAEAAAATIEWADATGDELASDLAAAAAGEALAVLEGEPLRAAVEQAALLASIVERRRSLLDLGATQEQRLVRQTFRDFALAEIAPHASDVHRRDLDVPESVIAGLAELGAFGQSVPEAYGGSQAEDEDFESMLIATEELSSASLAVGGSLLTRPEILVRALRRGATAEQKQRWLPEIASGDKLVAVATTEPDFGSDLARMDCRAERAEGGWLVTGTKLWCTFAGRAELVMLLLRTGDDGHRGLSVFVAEKPRFSGHEFRYEQPGGGNLEGRAIPTIGYRGMHTFELAFDRFFLPDIALVGGEEWLNRGFYLQVESFALGRLQTAGRAVGVMEAALQDALRYTSERHVFGSPISAFGLPRATLGRMMVRVMAARQLSYRAARLVSGGAGEMEASLAKLYACRMAEHVTREAMQLHGGMGYAEETNVSRYFVDARVLSIFEGAEDVLALRVIAPKLLEVR
jgi:(2S)-methylsuccinyl-CoA dehydrogenase